MESMESAVSDPIDSKKDKKSNFRFEVGMKFNWMASIDAVLTFSSVF